MDRVRRTQWATVAVMLAVLVFSGPLVGVVDLTPETRGAAALGDGTANATVAGDPGADLVIDEGRFGTNVSYLRIPPATVDLAAVEGRSRLLYHVAVPGLGFERSVTHTVSGDDERVTLRMDPRAFPRERIRNDSYRATITISVQSFEATRRIYRENASVPVHR
ncbi:hypothetical protein [Halorientalis halophila]|uniref:hypothetical protein n=1 Tax=Halorientalis halophila TaxID=3108499 RepID=UPI0030087103